MLASSPSPVWLAPVLVLVLVLVLVAAALALDGRAPVLVEWAPFEEIVAAFAIEFVVTAVAIAAALKRYAVKGKGIPGNLND